MATIRSEPLPAGRGVRLVVEHAGQPSSVAAVVAGWRDDPRFRAMFNAALVGVGFAAFRWELPPVTTASQSDPFECVVLDSPGLDRTPDPGAFADQFARDPGAAVVAFRNLGGDAVMIAPRPLGADSAYGHLAAFVRQAPEAQRDALWRLVGAAMTERIGSRPVWLSTAGAGVAWLHIRLDDRPKYIHHDPYRRPV